MTLTIGAKDANSFHQELHATGHYLLSGIRLSQSVQILTPLVNLFCQIHFYRNVNAVIRRTYPDAMRIASVLPDISCATFNPDMVDDPKPIPLPYHLPPG